MEIHLKICQIWQKCLSWKTQIKYILLFSSWLMSTGTWRDFDTKNHGRTVCKSKQGHKNQYFKNMIYSGSTFTCIIPKKYQAQRLSFRKFSVRLCMFPHIAGWKYKESFSFFLELYSCGVSLIVCFLNWVFQKHTKMAILASEVLFRANQK